MALLTGIMALAAGRWRQRLGLKPPLAAAIATTAPLWVAASLEPGRVRRAATWAAHMWAYKIAFEAPIDRRAALRERLRIDYPIAFDSALGGGKPLPQRLQELLRHPPRISLLDKTISILYSFWEIEPHLAMLWFLLRRPDAYPRAAGRLSAPST